MFCLPPQDKKDVAVPIFLMRKLDKRGNKTWCRLHSLTESLQTGGLSVLFYVQHFKNFF